MGVHVTFSSISLQNLLLPKETINRGFAAENEVSSGKVVPVLN
jgi:hypothetical protein